MNMKEPLIKANKVFKYSITFQETNDESREVSDFSDSEFIIENKTDEIGDILKLAKQTYGIYYPIAFGVWESTTPEQNAKYFEKGIETYYGLFIKNEDGTDITEEEYDFITFLLSDGNYNKSEFTDYAVGGVVLGALALGVGGLIGYYYFKNKKSSKKDSVDSRAKFVIHKINGKDRKFPIKDAWTKEHYHDNEDEDYEVEPSKRKVPARNRKFVDGGGVNDYDYEDIGQFSMPDSEWKNYSQEDFNRLGRKIVEEQFNGDLTRAYDSIVHKRTYFVVSAKNDKVVSRGFDTEEEAKKEMYSMFEKTGDFSYAIKKFVNGGTTTTRPTTTPEVVPDTDTKPSKPKTPFQPKHIPKPKARKYDFVLIK